MARKSAADLRVAKEKKQKKMAAVLGVLFVILLVVQVPRMMKRLDSGEPAAAPAEQITTATAPEQADVPLDPPTLDQANPTDLPVSATAVETSTHLVSFSRFESKDPFSQQLKGTDAGGPAAPEGGAGDEGAAEGGLLEPDGDGGDGDSKDPPVLSTAEISVNGVLESVKAGDPFPAAAPTFVLRSVQKKSATIGVAEGGDFSSGGGTLTLELGKPVTLVNTADGTQFVVELKSVG